MRPRVAGPVRHRLVFLERDQCLGTAGTARGTHSGFSVRMARRGDPRDECVAATFLFGDAWSMNDFLQNLANRALDSDANIRPRLPSLFEPAADPDPAPPM